MSAVTEKINLKQLERKAYLSYHQDGLVDLFVGTALLTFAVFMLLGLFLSEDYFFLPIWSGVFVAWAVSYAGAKRAITMPRLGYVQFSARTRGRVTAIFLGFVVVNVVLVIFGLLLWLDSPFQHVVIPILEANFLLLLGLVGGGIFVALGLVVGIRRFHGYSVVTFAAFALSQVFAIALVWPTIVLGVVTTVTGGVLLARFLRKYPKAKAGEMDDASPSEA
jgi:hypothetical protein